MMPTKFFNRNSHLTAIFIFVLILSGFAVRSECSAETKIVDRIVAIVNQDIITLTELSKITAAFEKAVKEKNYTPEQEKEIVYRMRQDAISRLIEKALTDQEAKRYGITINEKEVDASVERFKEQNRFNDEEFREALSKEGMSVDGFREETRSRIQRSKLLNHEIRSKIVITEADVKAYYEKNSSSSASASKLHLFHILKSYGEKTDSVMDNPAKAAMDDIFARLKKGEDFSALARLKSESPTAESGGDLGFFPLDDLSAEIKGAVEKLKPGEFTEVVTTSQGYQIFLLKDFVSEESKPLAESYAEIEEKLYGEIIEQRFKSWIDGLKEKAYIRIIN